MASAAGSEGGGTGRLIYFDLGGRAEGIRMLLAHANFQYEDARISMEEFAKLKRGGGSSLPLGSVPIWEEDGFIQAQSSSILRMLGARLGYYHDDPMICWRIDSLIDFVEDLHGKFAEYVLPVMEGNGLSDEGGQAWLSDYWDKLIPVLERRLTEHGQSFLAGTQRPTIADFKAFQTLSCSVYNRVSPVPPRVLDQLVDRIETSPNFATWANQMQTEIQDYLHKRPPRPF